MRSRERRQAPDGALVFVIIALLLPPAGNIAYREFLRWRQGSVEVDAARLRSLENRVASLSERLRLEKKSAGRLSALSPWSRDYLLHVARVLPITDSSPMRESFWISASDAGRLQRDMPVVTRDGVLAGRIDGTLAGRPLGRVQSILDRGFRVRFRHGDAWGFLQGTGEVDEATGRPLLDIRHLSTNVRFEAGEPVFTEGNDGRYPPGIVIGRLVPADVKTSLGGFRVICEFHPLALREVVILEDRGLREARALMRETEP